MSVDAQQIRLVRESLPLIRQRLVPASLDFYENLFAVAPELSKMFRSDLASQGMRFMTTLATIADLLDATDELEDEARDLARAHAGLGVREAHFAPMGVALMVTMAETLGAAFTPALQAAWHAAYDDFAARMIRRGGFA
ncbi:MAG: globin domain-containing protein [Amaricoccus sp.]